MKPRDQVYLHLPSADYSWRVAMHANTVENQIVAITNRVLTVTPVPEPASIERLRRIAIQLARHLPFGTRQGLADFYQSYSGRKRLRYEQAQENLQSTGLRKRHARVTMFVKPDKINTVAKENPDPRPIQFRAPEYCVELASYLKPLEHALYGLRMTHPNLKGKTRLVGKGLNQRDRAILLEAKMKEFASPVVVSLDMSRFDLHVSRELLQVEHEVYLNRFRHDRKLARLLRWQLDNEGSSKEGVRYKTHGRRMSGDMNTALGNCILMIVMVIDMLAEGGVVGQILDDGDDCLVVLNLPDLDKFLRVAALASRYGMTVKVENVAFCMEDVEWCQSRPILTVLGWKFVRNPWKIFNTSLLGTKWLRMTEKQRLAHLRAIGDCELILNRGVPVLQAYACALIRNSKGVESNTSHLDEGDFRRMTRESAPALSVDISFEARKSFERAFGIKVETQQLMEEIFDNWEFQITGETRWQPPVDPGWRQCPHWGSEAPLG